NGGVGREESITGGVHRVLPRALRSEEGHVPGALRTGLADLTDCHGVGDLLDVQLDPGLGELALDLRHHPRRGGEPGLAHDREGETVPLLDALAALPLARPGVRARAHAV